MVCLRAKNVIAVVSSTVPGSARSPYVRTYPEFPHVQLVFALMFTQQHTCSCDHEPHSDPSTTIQLLIVVRSLQLNKNLSTLPATSVAQHTGCLFKLIILPPPTHTHTAMPHCHTPLGTPPSATPPCPCSYSNHTLWHSMSRHCIPVRAAYLAWASPLQAAQPGGWHRQTPADEPCRHRSANNWVTN